MRCLAAGAVVLAMLADARDLRAQLATDMRLEDAGFVMKRADTPEKLARARALPPRQFVSRTRDGQRYYLYAETEFCKCVFVGDARALEAFRNMRAGLPRPDDVSPRHWSLEDSMIHNMDADAGFDSVDAILHPGF